jgi:Tfp pilus assembly protein PilP
MHFVKTLVLGITVAAVAPGLYAQAKPASGTGANPATSVAAKPAPQAAKPSDKTAGKPVAQAPAKPAAASPSTGQNKPAASGTKPAAPATGVKTQTQAATPGSKKAPKQTAKKTAPKTTKPAASARSSAGEDKEPKVAKRDPFESLVGREHAGPRTDLPAGKAGLQVSTLRLDGVVRAPNGMIAVVSNPQSRTYFLRDGDQLFDGRVEKIAMDGVSFHEVGKDAFGKPVERQVNKRIYASAGEQQ